MTGLECRLARELAALDAKGRLRAPGARRGIDVSSNDYLGLAAHPALRERVQRALSEGVPVGASGSRLLSGNHPAHEALEQAFARFMGGDRAALLFNSGYDANLAVLSTLPTRHDVLLLDALVHASIKEGARASFAQKVTCPHNDIEALERLLARHAQADRDVFVVAESLYSMDGDFAPLEALDTLAARYGAWLIIDEAHATGVFGKHGRGLLDAAGVGRSQVVSIHTCGKALGVAGAFVLGPQTITSYLINRARPFLFSTALPPLLACALEASLELVEREAWRRERVLALAARLRSALKGLRVWTVPDGSSQIIPVVIGADALAVRVAGELASRGFDVRAVRPPTVPEGTARLRLSLNALLREEEVDQLAAAILECEAGVAAESRMRISRGPEPG
jgi:8-amino-7-oxononanoate synthase